MEETENIEDMELEDNLKIEIDSIFYEIDLENQINDAENLLLSNNNSYINTYDCSKPIPSIQTNEYVLGPYNTLLVKSLNSYIPDLFRKCWLTPGIGIPEICPSIYTNARTIYFIPDLIDENLIKAFIYFGFSSNIYQNYGITVPYPQNLEYFDANLFFRSFFKDLYSENVGNFYNFTNHFTQKYRKNTLFSQLIFFRIKLNQAHNNTLSGKVNCPYMVPWDATSACNGYQLLNISELNELLDITLLNNIYTLFNLWLGNIDEFGNSNIPDTKTISTKQYFQNFFKVLLYTGQVFEDVVIEFSYRITKKCYCKRPYMTLEYYNKCKSLYQIYIENKKRLQ